MSTLDGLQVLEELFQENRSLRDVLHSRVIKALSQDASKPFVHDEEYIDVIVGYFVLRDDIWTARDKSRSLALEPNRPNASRDFDAHGKVLQGMETLMKTIAEIRDARLALSERKPRIVRLCDKFEFTIPERRIFEAIVIKDVVVNLGLGYLGTEIMSLSRSADITWKEVLDFVGSTRPHIKQNLFEYFDPERPMQSTITLMSTATAALFGQDLHDEELLKIDGTFLADVINEEKGVASSAGDADKGEDVKTEEKDPEVEEAKEEPVEELKPKSKLEEEEGDIGTFLKKLTASTEGLPPPGPDSDEDEDSTELAPYRSDLDYLETQIDYLFATVQLAEMKKEEDRNEVYGRYGSGSSDNEQRMRQLQAKERINRGKAQKRIELTKKASKWLPRVERMCVARNLDSFEREVLVALIACHISPKFHAIGHRNGMDVGILLRSFCKNFEEQVKNRKYFYKNATMIKEGIVRLQSGIDSDLGNCYCAVDRRMLDFAMGLDTEFSELVEGSHLYFPKVDLESVVLAEEQKRLIMDTVNNFEEFKRARRRFGFDDKVTYGSGMVMLFYGASGTGKTMLSNAIGHHLNKRILLINFPSLGAFTGDENLKWIFREAKINDAILFFDECESIFESRDNGNSSVNLLLTEFERHDGLVILATNRAFDLDEAMHRRVTIAIEFQKPDPILRERIWVANVPKALRLAADVDFRYLAMQFELTGGFIKNALLSALSMAVSRDGEDNCIVRQDDLIQGAKLQLRGRLRMVDFHRRQVPHRGLDDLILSKEKKKVLEDIVMFEKARQVLFSSWGFEKTMGQDRGTTVLLYGPPGTGKTMSCEALAFSMGKPLKVINSAELLSKWVGDTPKNIDAVFEEGKNFDAVLVFDEAEGLFGQRSSSSESSTDRYANVDVGLLLYHMERYPGVVVLSTNQVAAIDSAFFRRIKFVIEIPLPDAPERARLWRTLIPSQAPIEKDVDFKKLGQLYEFSGGHIQSCIIRASARAALHADLTQRRVTMDLLMAAAREEQEKTKHANVVKSMFT